MYSYDGVNMKPPSRVENEACGVKCLLHKLVHCAVACLVGAKLSGAEVFVIAPKLAHGYGKG